LRKRFAFVAGNNGVDEIVGVLVAAADREDAGADHVGEAVRDARRIARVGK